MPLWRLQDAIYTGNTGTCVVDLRVILIPGRYGSDWGQGAGGPRWGPLPVSPYPFMVPVFRKRECQPYASSRRCGVCFPGASSRARR